MNNDQIRAITFNTGYWIRFDVFAIITIPFYIYYYIYDPHAAIWLLIFIIPVLMITFVVFYLSLKIDKSMRWTIYRFK